MASLSTKTTDSPDIWMASLGSSMVISMVFFFEGRGHHSLALTQGGISLQLPNSESLSDFPVEEGLRKTDLPHKGRVGQSTQQCAQFEQGPGGRLGTGKSSLRSYCYHIRSKLQVVSFGARLIWRQPQLLLPETGSFFYQQKPFSLNTLNATFIRSL